MNNLAAMRDASLNGHKLNAATKYYGCNVNDSVDKSFEYLFSTFFSFVHRGPWVRAAAAAAYFKSHKNDSGTKLDKTKERNWRS